LKILDCAINILKSLPELPSNLTELNCGANQNLNFPELPSSLKKLDLHP
jgi:Leucine-rich repeat (LRR) protein